MVTAALVERGYPDNGLNAARWVICSQWAPSRSRCTYPAFSPDAHVKGGTLPAPGPVDDALGLDGHDVRLTNRPALQLTGIDVVFLAGVILRLRFPDIVATL